MRLLCAGLALAWVTLAAAASRDALPPRPARYFNDYAGVVSRDTAERLNATLEAFERKTSSQVLVAIFPRLPENAALEDYTVRTAEAWGVGQEQTDNGAVLFVFRDDRKLRIEVGYGLEGAIPDALAKRIIENEIVPRFRAGDFESGISAGVEALLAAAQGEYRGTGRTSAEGRTNVAPWLAIVFLVIFALIALFSAARRGTYYGRRRRTVWGTPWVGSGGWSGGSGGGGWSGGGGFSGGGGSFGGGGASGSW